VGIRELCTVFMETIFDTANISIEALNKRCENTLNTAIGLQFTQITATELHASLVVSTQNCQPLGHLNGGTSLAMIEILGSLAANLIIDTNVAVAVGQQVNAHHFRPALMGETVNAVASALHIGKKSHVWEVFILNTQGKLVCKGTITMAVIPRN
jgi:1,4-dihydroxy-2-naphthoyl-CoA hydrolase